MKLKGVVRPKCFKEKRINDLELTIDKLRQDSIDNEKKAELQDAKTDLFEQVIDLRVKQAQVKDYQRQLKERDDEILNFEYTIDKIIDCETQFLCVNQA